MKAAERGRLACNESHTFTVTPYNMMHQETQTWNIYELNTSHLWVCMNKKVTFVTMLCQTFTDHHVFFRELKGKYYFCVSACASHMLFSVFPHVTVRGPVAPKTWWVKRSYFSLQERGQTIHWLRDMSVTDSDGAGKISLAQEDGGWRKRNRRWKENRWRKQVAKGEEWQGESEE